MGPAGPVGIMMQGRWGRRRHGMAVGFFVRQGRHRPVLRPGGLRRGNGMLKNSIVKHGLISFPNY